MGATKRIRIDRLDQVLVRLQARDRRAAGHRDLLELVQHPPPQTESTS